MFCEKYTSEVTRIQRNLVPHISIFFHYFILTENISMQAFSFAEEMHSSSQGPKKNTSKSGEISKKWSRRSTHKHVKACLNI